VHRLLYATHFVLLALAVSVVAPRAWGQEPPPGPPGPIPGSTGPEAVQIVPEWAPPITAYPAELLGLLGAPAQRGPLTLIPSIAVSEEYNDNVLLDNHTRRGDFVTRFSPAFLLTANRPDYEVRAGYTLSAELYAHESELNDPLKNHRFVATGLYRGIRGLTFTVAETFGLNRDTNLVASQGFSTGRQETWSNTFSPGLTWQFAPQTSLSVSASSVVQRFLSADTTTSTRGSDSNTYGLLTTVDHDFTRRFTGTIGYGFAYLDFLGEASNAISHTAILGGRYVVTPTLTAWLRGGPIFTQVDNNTFVSPFAVGKLVQVFSFGSVTFEYSRTIGVAGGFGGTNDTQTISAGLTLPTWQRGLIIAFTPTYNTATSTGGRQATNVDVNALSIPLAVSYQFARWAFVFAEYRFFRQRTGSTSSASGTNDIDQNRLRFGVQFGYPFNFE
jgi:Putative beta-barrel porin 2